MRQPVRRLWAYTRLPYLRDPSGPSLAPQTAEPLAPYSSSPSTRQSRGTRRRLAVVPSLANGGTTVSLRWGYGDMSGRLGTPFPRSTENSQESENGLLAVFGGTGNGGTPCPFQARACRPLTANMPYITGFPDGWRRSPKYPIHAR